MELPIEFKKRMMDLLKDEYPRFTEAFEKGEAVRALRVNPLKCTSEKLLENAPFALSPLSFTGGAFFFGDEKAGADPLHHAGAYYVQDPGAMSTVFAASHVLKKGMRIIDLCAAPGGKSSQLLEYTDNGGFLVSNEIDRKRCRVLRGNLERMGARRAVLTNTDTEALAKLFGSAFDFVLCDAPCSGEGMMRKYTEAVEEWSVENVLTCAGRQKEILTNAARLCAPGGYLMYSTCTFSLEENEMTVDSFLSGNTDFSIVPVEKRIREVTASGVCFEGAHFDMSECRRFYPHISPGEGQFICLMKKREDGECFSPENEKDKKKKEKAPAFSKEDIRALERFYKDNIECDIKELSFALVGEWVMENGTLPLPASCVFSGVCVGSLQKGRLEPHHHLFSAMGEHFKRKVMLSSKERSARAYLSGEVIDTDIKDNGWCAVFIDGIAVGGGKIVDGKVKNHYPKGLRLLG